MALPDELILRLSSQSVGSTTSTGTWPIWMDTIPEQSTRARAIVIVESGGIGPFDTAETGELFRPTFQVTVRAPSSSPTTGREKMDDVITALHRWNGTLGSRKYIDVTLQGDVAPLGEDANRRTMYAANFLALRSQTT